MRDNTLKRTVIYSILQYANVLIIEEFYWSKHTYIWNYLSLEIIYTCIWKYSNIKEYRHQLLPHLKSHNYKDNRMLQNIIYNIDAQNWE